jgi:tRNA (cytidine32/uridine32-2'-O)-methyltransferase
VNPARCDVVLVRPVRPANVAAACRAMKNMGLGALWLVAPPDGLDSREVRSLASGAWDVLDNASVATSLREATSGCTFVVATSGRPGAGEWSPRRLATESGERAGGGRMAIVFGPEASGLTTLEIGLCHVTVRIPTTPEQPSLNLAQAVLLVGYELLLSTRGESDEIEAHASAGELEGCLDDLRRALLDIGFLNPDNPEALLAELRRLLARSRPTPREVSLLRGIARQAAWAGKIARGTDGAR